MKTGIFLIFITVVTVVYGLVNSYIFIRGLQAIPPSSAWRTPYVWGFWIIASTFIAARFMERIKPCGVTEVITWVGSFWLAFMLYFILAAVLVDLARVFSNLFHIYPQSLFADYGKTKLTLLLSTIAVVTLIVCAGFINARNPRVKKIDIHVNKNVSGEKSLRIVMASDIHLGTIIAKRKANRLVETINSLNPDIVLFAGDVVDEDLAPVIRRNLGANFNRIRATLGIYAITGNHEYIGGAEAAVKYLTDHGVTVLRDTVLLIDERFYLVGREDRDRPRFSGKKRKEIGEIMQAVDRSFPVILMDHQPFNLDQTVAQGVDLQLSGHTHHGQLWPFNHITNAMYEISCGYRQIGNTHFFVSTGFGTWGPPVRLGNRPEIVQITVTFN